MVWIKNFEVITALVLIGVTLFRIVYDMDSVFLFNIQLIVLGIVVSNLFHQLERGGK